MPVLKTCNRRGLFGLLAAPLVALVDPSPAEAEPEEKACVHEPMENSCHPAGLELGVMDQEQGVWRTGELVFCKHCGDMYIKNSSQPREPLPKTIRGIHVRHADQSARLGTHPRWFK